MTACGLCPDLGARVTWDPLAETRVALRAHAPDTPHGNRSRDPSLKLSLEHRWLGLCDRSYFPAQVGSRWVPPRSPLVLWNVPEGHFPVRVNSAPSTSHLPPPSPRPGHPGSLCPRRTHRPRAPGCSLPAPRRCPGALGAREPGPHCVFLARSRVLRNPRGHECLRCPPPPQGRCCGAGAR